MNNLFAKYNNIILMFFLMIVSCNNQNIMPKQRGYFRIDLPPVMYQQYISNYPYTFQYSQNARINNYMTDSCWVDIFYPYFDATIYLTYKKVGSCLRKYLEDTHTLVYKHAIKADAISQQQYSNSEKKVYGMLYEIKGNAASSIQFFVTDSITNFLRGALYFNTKPNKDSLAPVINYIKTDIVKIMESFEWKAQNTNVLSNNLK